jgi:MoaA/NifB/PqqE/SkfB family radical SAM enzyme
MSLDVFKKSLDFLDRSRIDQVRILGGEPTLHLQFKEFLTLAKNTGRKMCLFTNGLFSDDILESLLEITPDVMTVMVNITPRNSNNTNETDRQRRVIRKLAERVMLSFNIYRPDISFNILLELLEENEAQRTVRLGLALPCIHGNNKHLHPQQYSFIGSRIVEFAEQAARCDIRLSFDCGFVPCMYDEEGLEVLKVNKADIGWRCNPILDITTSRLILHCFPLARMFSEPLTDKLKASDIRAKLTERARPFRQAGIFNACSLCDLKSSDVCPGGCLAATIRRFHRSNP